MRIGPWKEEELERGISPQEQEAPGVGQEMVGNNKIRRLAYQTAVVGAAAAALSLTAAGHSSNSSANTFSRDRSGEISVITDHMTSVGWRVPDRLTQEAALRGSSVAAPFDILVIGTTSLCHRVSSASRV